MGLKEMVLLRLARRWISGVDLEAAIRDSKKENSRGVGVVVNFLGEDIKDTATADSHVAEYLRLQQALADNSIRGFASVKLTQLGLLLDEGEASARLEKIADNAQRLDQWLWVDMESSKMTDETLSIYKSVISGHPRLGLAVQAYLRRTEADLKSLLDGGARVRLVKGAYREGDDIALRGKSAIRRNYLKLMQVLFDRGDHFAIATHDSVLVDAAKNLADSSHAEFRFEFLKGIREDLKVDLVKSGYKVYDYLPYGDRWYAYSKRRMTEHPSNIWLLLRSLL